MLAKHTVTGKLKASELLQIALIQAGYSPKTYGKLPTVRVETDRKKSAKRGYQKHKKIDFN